MKPLRLAWILPVLTLVFCGLHPSAARAEVLHYSNEHWPPYVIVDQAGEMSGIDLEILRELARRLNLTVEATTCNWVQCLRKMETGRQDVISAALRRPEREKYMFYITPPYILCSNKLFYILRGSGVEINGYRDVHGLKVGVLNGSAYFAPFDDDPKVNKVAVLRTEQLLYMLNAGRLDAMIGTELVTDYLIRERGLEGRFVKSAFRHDSGTPFHFAISKKSPLAAMLPRFNAVMKALIDEGFVARVVEKYTGTRP